MGDVIKLSRKERERAQRLASADRLAIELRANYALETRIAASVAAAVFVSDEPWLALTWLSTHMRSDAKDARAAQDERDAQAKALLARCGFKVTR